MKITKQVGTIVLITVSLGASALANFAVVWTDSSADVRTTLVDPSTHNQVAGSVKVISTEGQGSAIAKLMKRVPKPEYDFGSAGNSGDNH